MAIACQRFFGHKTYDNVAAELCEIHTRFGLVGEKLLTTTTDNASYFIKAFRMLGFFHGDDGL